MSRYRRFSLAHSFSQILRFVLPVAVFAVSAARAKAQAPAITEGSRIQVSATGQKKVTGVVRSVSADSTTLFVDGRGGTLKFANRDISELKLSGGRTHTAGAKKGGLWGGAIGGLLAIAILASPDNSSDYEYPAYSSKRIAFSTFVGSVLWGVGLEAVIKAEEWNSIPVRPALSSSSGGMGLSLAFSPSFLH